MMLHQKDYYELKKYRGLLLAKITDLVNNHFEHHIIGTTVQQCQLCQQYVQLKQQFDELDDRIKAQHELKRRAPLHELSQRTYAYVCSYKDGTQPCLVIEVNQIAARQCFIKRMPAQYADIKVKRISREAAIQLVEAISPEAVQAYSRFLNRFEHYTGFVLSLARPLTVIRGELAFNTQQYGALLS